MYAYSNNRLLFFLFRLRFNEMTSLLLIRTIILIFIQNSWCAIRIKIETRKVDLVTRDTGNGGNTKHLCSSTTERAIIVNQTLKCVSEKAIKLKVDATNETRGESKCCFIYYTIKLAMCDHFLISKKFLGNLLDRF